MIQGVLFAIGRTNTEVPAVFSAFPVVGAVVSTAMVVYHLAAAVFHGIQGRDLWRSHATLAASHTFNALTLGLAHTAFLMRLNFAGCCAPDDD